VRNAKEIKWTTLKAAPKDMRGTWYHYDKRAGFSKVIIKKHRVSYNTYDGNARKYTNRMNKIPSLVIHKGSWRPKRANYAFESKNGATYGTVFYNYTMRIKGKRRHVLVMPSRDIAVKPIVYINSKIKHEYFAPRGTQS